MVLVRRQINQMVEEEENQDLVVVVDKKGKTGMKMIEKVLNDKRIVFT